MPYPENCIRGILKEVFIIKDNDCVYATAELYQFRSNLDRQDEMHEASINWGDDEMAIDFALNQKNDEGNLKFEGGVAILPRNELDKIKKRYGITQFNYERSLLQDNKYHGNLLINVAISPTIKRMISAVLAHNSEIQQRTA